MDCSATCLKYSYDKNKVSHKYAETHSGRAKIPQTYSIMSSMNTKSKDLERLIISKRSCTPKGLFERDVNQDTSCHLEDSYSQKSKSGLALPRM